MPLRKGSGSDQLNDEELSSLQRFYGKGIPYYNLIHNGVQFKEYVGVLQIGHIQIEVLPKSDKNNYNEDNWRKLLIGMLKSILGFEVKVTSSANLKIRPNSILDLYFEMFINEVEYLFHLGLIKRYNRTQGNTTALKGTIIFSKQIQLNLTRQDRFYNSYTTYDREHYLNQILFKTLKLLKKINLDPSLKSRIGNLLLNFPELNEIKVSESLFSKIDYNRKTLPYKKSIEIAKMILLQYHPDLTSGNNDVLALMFDMNSLWEQFILVSLRKQREFSVKGQQSKYFWKPQNGNRRSIRPDILIEKNGKNYILDTKWKNIDNNPTIDDIRQMYVYQHYYEANKAALVYPGIDNYFAGNFMDLNNQNSISNLECGLMPIKPEQDIKKWQKEIIEKIKNWAE
jgi:5-methylcytosine-specific restriction enzyme subunit McrC